MSRRKLKYGSQDWFDTIHSEVRVPREPRVPREQSIVNVMYPQMAPCPPGYKYRPKRKPGQRRCTKETVKSVLSFLQMLATQNRISIFKPRKDKKGYTKTLLTIPQLKSRLTRHGINYKIKMKINTSNFGMDGSQTRRPVYAELSDAGREALNRLRQNRTRAVNNTAISYYHWLRNPNNSTRDGVIEMLVLLLIERLRTLPISDNPGRDAVNEMLEAYREDARLVYNREDEFIAGMGPVDNSYFYREMENVYDRIEHLHNRQSGGRGETGRGGSGDIESTESTEGFRGRDIEFEFPRITSGRLPRLEMLRYMQNVNPRDSTPTGDNDENYPTGSTEFGRRNKMQMQMKMKMKANMNMNKYKFGMMMPEGEVPPVSTIQDMAMGRERAERINTYKFTLENGEQRLAQAASAEGVRVYDLIYTSSLSSGLTADQARYHAERHSKRASEQLIARSYAASRAYYTRRAADSVGYFNPSLGNERARQAGIEWDEAFASYMVDKAARDSVVEAVERPVQRRRYLPVTLM